MQYWLMKSEPSCYSIQDLKNEPTQSTFWDGVRNYQARNMMRDDMKAGDQVFFYHSNCDVPGIVGVMEVIKEAYPDDTALDPNDKHYDPKSTQDNVRWVRVDVKFVEDFGDTISLQALKANPILNNLALVKKGNRLSIMPVGKPEWQAIHEMR